MMGRADGEMPPTQGAVQPPWWDRLAESVDIDRALVEDEVYRHGMVPRGDPDYREHRARLRIARGILLDELDRDPADRAAADYLSRIEAALGE